MHLTGKISPKPLRGFRLKSFSVTFLLIFSLNVRLAAQFSETFSDGDFSDNPSWEGNTADFIVNPEGELQLNTDQPGTSWLTARFAVSPAEAVAWEFFVKQSFAPSGANFGRVYLMSDQPDLTTPLNGYYLQLGEAGSADAVELFCQSGNIRRSVCRAPAAAISAAFQIGVKVTLTDGRWELHVDYSGGTNYTLEAAGFDQTHTQAVFFGIACTHTVTNGTRFYFDNFSFRKYTPPDTTAPGITSLSFTSPNSLRVTFSETVQRAGAEDVLHYLVWPQGRHPAKAVLHDSLASVELTFDQSFQNGFEVSLTVEQVADLAGNVMTTVEKKIRYFVPSPVLAGDVVITEVLADPLPRIKLPGAEFIEIFNRSANPVQMAGWTVADGTSVGVLPEYILLPERYLIICASADTAEYNRLGVALPCANFPTLNNAGDRLTLTNADGNRVDSVRYSASWYRDEDKAGGGWSLERIDPGNFCEEEKNWTASEDPAGGTPGRKNAVYATMPDGTGPKLLYTIPISADSLLVAFDEKLDAAPPVPDAFTLAPRVPIEDVGFFDASRTTLIVTLKEMVRTGTAYLLEVSDVYDCTGNRVQRDFSQCSFVMPAKAIPGDIVINELLFNPTGTGADFVEIFNRSEKTIDLLNWSIRNTGSAAGTRQTILVRAHSLMPPNAFRVFTENAVVLRGEYQADVGTILETDLPPFNDDAGSAALFDSQGLLIDSMRYSDEMHSPFLKDTEGVSLERISVFASATDAENWYSASAAAGFATPGYANSTLRTDFLQEDDVVVEPEVVQPDIATASFARIRFRFPRPGLVANVKILDSRGRLVRNIAQNELLGSEGFLRWDGDRDDGSPARVGYYLIWFEVFDATGFIKTYRRRVAVY